MNIEQTENPPANNPAPRRLLICTQSINRDDPIAGFFYSWVCEFAKHCEQVTVIALSGTGVEHLPANVQVISLEKEHQAGKFRQLYLFYRAIITNRHEYDTVFVHNVGPKFVILGAPFWKLWHKQIALWYVHGSVDWRLRIAEKLVDQAFSSAPETFRVPSKKVTFLGHGINVEKLGNLSLQLDPRCFNILQVSRISPRKHCEILLETLPLFAEQYKKPFKVTFVGAVTSKGDETYLAKLQKRVNELGFSEQVSFVGGVSPQKLPEYYTRANVTVNITTTGGVDKTALESLAVGVPVLTTFGAFKNILGPLADEYLLSELHEGTTEELTKALLIIAKNGTSLERKIKLKECVSTYASLSLLIERIMGLLSEKTDKFQYDMMGKISNVNMDKHESVGNDGERMVLGSSSKRVEEDHLSRYEFAKRYVANKRVLDIACGTGYGAKMLSEAGAIEVVGVDIDQGAIDYATQKYRKADLRFVCDSVSNVSFPPNYFDVVVTFETVEHLDNDIRSQYLNLIKNVLKKDGVIILSTPNKLITSPWSEKPLNPHHVLEYYRDDLVVELKGHGLTVKEWFGQRFIKKIFTHYPVYICVRVFEKLTRKPLHIYDIADSAEVRPVIAGKEPRYFIVTVNKHDT